VLLGVDVVDVVVEFEWCLAGVDLDGVGDGCEEVSVDCVECFLFVAGFHPEVGGFDFDDCDGGSVVGFDVGFAGFDGVVGGVEELCGGVAEAVVEVCVECLSGGSDEVPCCCGYCGCCGSGDVCGCGLGLEEGCCGEDGEPDSEEVAGCESSE